MLAKNYYSVLGISRNESPSRIRFAYHELAKRTHQDSSGRMDTPAFQEINEAYEVLSDSGRRRTHDEQLDGVSRKTEIPVTYKPPVEPLAPEPISLLGRRENTYPSFERFFDRYVRNFTGHHVPKAEWPESLTVDVVLSPTDAMTGCWIPVGVPAFRPCGACGGSGQVWLRPCIDCHGSGLEELEHVMRVGVPPFVRAGTVLEAPLDTLGIQNLYLRVHVSISDEVL
ncbi:MAG: DnaJ domain-containing protein [Acidobacteriaceae bacterium]|nr:DnaJ domain-containing protein [Acidobacteriaceae bacterium]